MSYQDVLNKLANNEITAEQAGELLKAAMPAERGKATPRLKITEKGCLGMRGVPGTNVKFGLSLYATTVEWILDNADTLKQFISDNGDRLARKVVA